MWWWLGWLMLTLALFLLYLSLACELLTLTHRRKSPSNLCAHVLSHVILQCMATTDNPRECYSKREDYLECLHHRKEVRTRPCYRCGDKYAQIFKAIAQAWMRELCGAAWCAWQLPLARGLASIGRVFFPSPHLSLIETVVYCILLVAVQFARRNMIYREYIRQKKEGTLVGDDSKPAKH